MVAARESETPRPSSRTGVRAGRIEEGEDVVLLEGGRVVVPAQTVVQRQLAVDLPGVARVQDVGGLARICIAHRPEGHVGVVHRAQQQAGDRTAAVDAEQAGRPATEIEAAGLVAVGVDVASDVAVFEAELEGVVFPDPGEQVVGHVGRPGGDVARGNAGVAPPLREVVAELNLGAGVVAGHARDLRQLVHRVGVDATVALVAVQVAEGEVVQQIGSESVVPVRPVDPGVLRVGQGLAGELVG